MKTHIVETYFLNFYKQTIQPLCESFSENGRWRSLLSLVLPVGVLPLEQSRKQSTESSQTQTESNAYAGQVRRAIHAINLLATASVNKRIYVGLVLVGVLAPVAGSFYVYLSQEVIDKTWYYRNYFNLFLVLGPSLKMICVFLGLFFFMPQGSKRAYLLALPLGEEIGKIIWLISITTNEQYWSIAPFHILFVGFVIAIVLLISSDWLSWRFFHRELAHDARLKLIYSNREEFSSDKLASMYNTVMKEKVEFQKQY